MAAPPGQPTRVAALSPAILPDFPNKVLCRMIQHLDINSACSLRQTSKRFASLVGYTRFRDIRIAKSQRDASRYLGYLLDGQRIFCDCPTEKYPISAIKAARFITVHILQGPEVPTWKGPLSFPHPFADDGFEHEANYPRDDDTIITRRQPSTIVNELVGIFHALNLRPEARLAEGLSLDLRGLSSEQITQLKDQLPAVQKLRTKSIMLYEPTTSGVGFIISHCDPLTLRHAHYYDRFSGDPTGWLLTPHGSTLTRLRAPTFAELDHDEFNLEEFTQGFPNLERLVLDSYATFAGCIDPTMRTEFIDRQCSEIRSQLPYLKRFSITWRPGPGEVDLFDQKPWTYKFIAMRYLANIPQLEMMTVRSNWPSNWHARRDQNGKISFEGREDMRVALRREDKWPLICF